jgi:hypothetical protein
MPVQPRAAIEARLRDHPKRLVEVVDYLLVTTDDSGDRIPAGWQGSIDLYDGVRIERLEPTLSERMLVATELRGEGWSPVARLDHVVHAYVRRAWHEADGTHEVPSELHNWDAEGHVYRCAQLSRLVRDNATTTEHAVRRLVIADGDETLVPFDGYHSHVAYRLYPDRQGWLDVGEAQQLATLARAYSTGPGLPGRVGRALRRADSVTRARYLQDALPIVVGGLESLVEVGTTFVSAQFRQRVPALAAEVGVAITPAEARALYANRSALVHGGDVDLTKPHERSAFEQGYVALLETLRRAVRRAIEDRTFAAVFDVDAQITARWPTFVKDRGTRRIV